MSMGDLKKEAKAAAAAKLARMAATFGHDSEVAAAKAAKPPAMKSGSSMAKTSSIEGTGSRRRLDRTNYKKGGRAKTDVNIIIEPTQPQQPVPPMGGPMPPHGAPPMAGPPPMPPRPMPPAAGAMPPNMGPRAPLPMRKEGGRADYDAGAGSGRGRLEKAAKYGNKT